MNSIHHSFNIDLAEKYGVPEAIIIHHFQHWIRVNRRLKRNVHEGRTWSYQTIQQIAAHFPYLSHKQVERLLVKLVKLEVLCKGNFNKHKYDRTVWYAFVNEEEMGIARPDSREDLAISPSGESLDRENDFPKSGNGDHEIGTPIPDPIPDSKTTTAHTRAREAVTPNPLKGAVADEINSSKEEPKAKEGKSEANANDSEPLPSILKECFEVIENTAPKELQHLFKEYVQNNFTSLSSKSNLPGYIRSAISKGWLIALADKDKEERKKNSAKRKKEAERQARQSLIGRLDSRHWNGLYPAFGFMDSGALEVVVNLNGKVFGDQISEPFEIDEALLISGIEERLARVKKNPSRQEGHQS